MLLMLTLCDFDAYLAWAHYNFSVSCLRNELTPTCDFSGFNVFHLSLRSRLAMPV
jgi:hypothetical protein